MSVYSPDWRRAFPVESNRDHIWRCDDQSEKGNPPRSNPKSTGNELLAQRLGREQARYVPGVNGAEIDGR